jgi:hypothetical protein
MSKIRVAPIAGIIILASIFAISPIKKYFDTRNEFLTEYNRIIATQYDPLIQEPIFDKTIDDLIKSNSNRRFLTRERKENLLFQKAFLNRLNNYSYLQFKQNYPEDPKIPFLDSIFSSLFIYRIEPPKYDESFYEFILKELLVSKNDTTYGQSFYITKLKISTHDFEKDTVLLTFELIDQNEKRLDYYDLRFGSIVRLNEKIIDLPPLQIKIPNKWQILNYIQPKLIVIKAEIRDQGSQTEVKDYFPGMAIQEINNQLLPREFKIIPYEVSHDSVWGILSYVYSESSQKTNWKIRKESVVYKLSNVKFTNISEYRTTWDKVKDTYMEQRPDDSTDNPNSWVYTGSLQVIPPFKILE